MQLFICLRGKLRTSTMITRMGMLLFFTLKKFWVSLMENEFVNEMYLYEKIDYDIAADTGEFVLLCAEAGFIRSV